MTMYFASADASLELTLCLLLGIIVAFAVLFSVICHFFRNPFEYPYFKHSFDVTAKRNVKIEDYIDSFLLDAHNRHALKKHELYIQQWKRETENHIQCHKFQKYRTKQYYAVLDDNHAYRFKTIRKQTRYKQKNYVKSSYKVAVVDLEWTANWNWIEERCKKLESIGFETTLNDYNSKQQRSLMTVALKNKIKERDNYTCQICGKYMPDEVGLHIDHIIPIAKGGKSMPSNLQVLCSKCNGRKSSK